MMATRLIIDGNAVYEIDEECLKKRQRREPERRTMRGQEAKPGKRPGKKQ
ncbi:hypothetical protein [Lachnoclostridium sp. An14]|nr:hypothetical protein [Lachnoclostridium sp. An14]